MFHLTSLMFSMADALSPLLILLKKKLRILSRNTRINLKFIPKTSLTFGNYIFISGQ